MFRRMTIMAFCLLFLTAALTGCATTRETTAPAQASAEPAFTPFHDIVDMAFVKQHVSIPLSQDVMLIDARPYKPKYIKGHIPMAVSIPDSQFDKMTDKLPANKDALLIFYCGGLKCKLSHKSATKAEKLGYTNVKVFAEGYPQWISDKSNYPAVSAEWVKEQIDKGADMVLVDSRPKRKKFDKGHIPTAISIPDMQFDDLKDQLPAEKSKLVVFYCGGLHCKLSHKSAARAIAMGYTNVKVFAEGYPAWVAYAGKASAATASAGSIKAGEEEGSIDHAEFKRLVNDSPEAILLVDVRDADEYKKGSLKTAVNIPIDNLEEKIKTLPADKPVVFICGTGARSGEAFYMVQDVRPELKNVFYVDGEMTIKKNGSFTLKKLPM
ncbi:rhodanese-like domain-containing protein [Breoghania sp.]|uniref:rhodanese-like domain-containing protein n=1 Tax=Breoghania sp. TaxID=2065378 RepID=UPI0029C88502|nr:rhodanese-like domain-containing protein [Breoghania sp.]